MNAEVVFRVALFAMVGILLGLGVEDFVRWYIGEPTVTAYLRDNPGWYWWSASLAVAFILALGLHLFFDPRGR